MLDYFFSSAFKFWEQEKLHLESRGCKPSPGNAVPEPGSLPWHHHRPHQCGGCGWASCVWAQHLLCGSARGCGDWNHHTDHFCQGPRRDQQLHQVCPLSGVLPHEHSLVHLVSGAVMGERDFLSFQSFVVVSGFSKPDLTYSEFQQSNAGAPPALWDGGLQHQALQWAGQACPDRAH